MKDMNTNFDIKDDSHSVSPQVDYRFDIVCEEYRPAGYSHDESLGIDNSDWMKQISDRTTKLSSLSLPGTHDTMSFYGGDAAQCQTLSLKNQLESGIRVLDIRCRHIADVFAIHHGMVFQKTYFSDVLNIVINFLQHHNGESIYMRVKEEYKAENNTRTFEETFNMGYWKPYNQYFWDPEKSLNPKNPTLEETSGKIVILQGFEASKSYGISWESLDIQDDYNLGTNWDLYDKWLKVKAQLDKANNNNNPETTIVNFLSGSGGSFPYFVASGQSSPETDGPRLLTGRTTPGWKDSWPDFPRVGCFIGICSIAFEGTNILSAERIGKDNTFNSKVGIVMCDFPGKDLIERIISLN